MGVAIGLVEQIIEKIAPKSWAEDWDNIGLLVGSSAKRIDKILLALAGWWSSTGSSFRKGRIDHCTSSTNV
jgi:hypothetical protein